jgi:hypothetical protein
VLTKHNKRTDHCGNPDAAVILTVEIKERNLSFTCPADFPYDTVFVDDLRGLGKETLRPFAYVFLSKLTGQWVWLTTLDKNDEWSEQTIRDTTRQHDMGILVAPKKHLRPASQLLEYLIPHESLGGIDGDTGLFVSGGGEVEERERYVEKTNPLVGNRGGTIKKKTRNDMG